MDSLIKKPRTERGVATLNKILSAAAQVFYEKGYSRSNVNEIARLAGVATGTFYIYFDGKYNLYKYLLLQCSHQIRKHLSQSTKNCTTRQEAERVGLRSWLEYTLKNPYVYNLIWESLYVDRQLFVDYYDTFCRAYVRGLNQSKFRGEVNDIDSEVLAYTLMGATSFLGLSWGVFKDGTQDLDYVVDEFMKLLNGGLFTGQSMDVAPPAAPAREAAFGELMFRVEVDKEFLEENSGDV